MEYNCFMHELSRRLAFMCVKTFCVNYEVSFGTYFLNQLHHQQFDQRSPSHKGWPPLYGWVIYSF